LKEVAVPKEIERKYLVDPTKFGPNDLKMQTGSYTQGYIVIGPTTVRVRYEGPRQNPTIAWITVKGEGTVSRSEFEFELKDYDQRRLAVEMLHEMAGENMLQKNRYTRPWPADGTPPGPGKTNLLYWEIDEFVAPERLKGLYLTEIELESEDQQFVPPPWVTEEVTKDVRWTNARLAQHGIPQPGPVTALEVGPKDEPRKVRNFEELRALMSPERREANAEAARAHVVEDTLKDLFEAVRLFRNEDLLGKATALRGTPGFSALVEAWERARDVLPKPPPSEKELARLKVRDEVRAQFPPETVCHSDCDGDCTWKDCPQLRDGEPAKSGRHCPLDRRGEDD
jgi:CYTH domain-containing protein